MKSFRILALSFIGILIFSNIIFIGMFIRERNNLLKTNKEFQTLRVETSKDLCSFKFDCVVAGVESNINGVSKLGDTVIIQPFLKGFLVSSEGKMHQRPYILLYEYHDKQDQFTLVDSLEYKGYNYIKYIPKTLGKHHLFGLIKSVYPEDKPLSFEFFYPFIVSNTVNNKEYTKSIEAENQIYFKFLKYTKRM